MSVPATTASSSIALPPTGSMTAPMLSALTSALGVDRSILAGDDQIEHAWNSLPRLLGRIPIEQRSETLVRMCVAVATGLFDSAINYAWNAAIIELRIKVRRFGLTVIPQVTGKDFDEAALLDLQDAHLLDLCLKLNLISEDGYFLLDQCRNVRNNFSAAHPSMGVLDEDELLSFLNRVGRHALANERNPRGVDIQAFLTAVKRARFTVAQRDTWQSRVRETFDAQRELLFGTLHGIYCDPASGEEARLNSFAICHDFSDVMTPQTISTLVSRHEDYRAKGDDPRHKASQQFFERLGKLSLLGDTEVHGLISTATAQLLAVHNGTNNFYNEPAFANRLSAISVQNQVPESARYDFVNSVVTCATGNPYGVSHAAIPSYHAMIRSFSPAEVRVMLELPTSSKAFGRHLQSYDNCKTRFRNLVKMLDSTSVPTVARNTYNKWINGTA